MKFFSVPTEGPCSTTTKIGENQASRHRLFNEGLTVSQMTVVLKRELGDSVLESSDLLDIAIPDGCLPFQIDDAFADLIGADAVYAERPLSLIDIAAENVKRASDRYGIGKTTAKSNEDSISTWMNSIAKFMYKYFEEQFNDRTSPLFNPQMAEQLKKKSFFNKWDASKRNSILEGSALRRKPDSALRRSGEGLRKSLRKLRNWIQVLCICEITTEDFPDRLKFTLMQKAAIIFRNQPGRRFVPALAFCRYGFQFSIFDRSGVVRSPIYSITKNIKELCKIIAFFAFASDEELGFSTVLKADSTHGLIIRLDGKDFKVKRVLFQADGIKGRGTKIYAVTHIATNKDYVIKEVWVDSTREYFESDFFDRIAKAEVPISGVPKLFLIEKIKLRGVIESTARFREHMEKSLYTERYHEMLVIEPTGKRITRFSSKRELIQAIIQIVEAHEALCRIGILHRDISLNNILFLGDDGGLLIDFDYALFIPVETAQMAESQSAEPQKKKKGKMADAKPAQQFKSGKPKRGGKKPSELSANERTGTLPFMACEALLGEDRYEHTHAHDLESLFYVLVWICIHCAGPNGHLRNMKDAKPSSGNMRNKCPTDDWFPPPHSVEWKELNRHKVGFIHTFKRDSLPWVHEYFEDMKPLLLDYVKALWDVKDFRKANLSKEEIEDRMSECRGSRVTHRRIIGILRSYLEGDKAVVEPKKVYPRRKRCRFEDSNADERTDWSDNLPGEVSVSDESEGEDGLPPIQEEEQEEQEEQEVVPEMSEKMKRKLVADFSPSGRDFRRIRTQ